jgi:hypothetical protein
MNETLAEQVVVGVEECGRVSVAEISYDIDPFSNCSHRQ